ncbi:MAG: restriction endonuclease [Burkholderiales bacterium]
MAIPTFDNLFNPLLQAIHELGGSATVTEQEDKVASIMKFSDKEIAEIHRGSHTKLYYTLTWARNYLKHYGLIENSSRGVWALTAKGQNTLTVNPKDVKKAVAQIYRESLKKEPTKGEIEEKIVESEESTWEDQLLEIIKGIPPDSFERLCQRILRESGFIQVEVTGKTGDGGIDGKGVVRIGGLLSFHVIFQCKRYQGSVSSSTVRDFRGAMVGRADKGLLITTGTFTKDARLEAQRDGAPPIDLIDGESLVQKLKELGMGVEIKQKMIEEIIVNKDYFQGI